MSPTLGEGDIVSGADPVGVGVTNRLPDFNKICINC